MKFQHAGEVRDTTRRQGIDWSGTDRIYSDIVLAKICGKVSCAGFKGRLGDAHNVIIGDNLFCSVVGHTDYASAIGHQWSRGPRQRSQRKCADLHRGQETISACVYKFALQFFLWRKGDTVDQKINASKLGLDFLKKTCDLFRLRNITWQHQ